MQRNAEQLENDWLEPEEESFDIRKIVNKFISLWPWALLGAVTMILVACIYLYFAAPVYNINASILIKDNTQQGGTSGGASDLSMLQNLGLLTGASNVDNEQQILQSYTLMYQVDREMQLNVQYFVSNGIRKQEAYGKNVPFIAYFLAFQEDTLKVHSLSYVLEIKDKNHFVLTDDKATQTWKGSWGDTLTLPAGKAVMMSRPAFSEGLPQEYTIAVANTESTIAAYMKALTLTIPDKQASVIDLVLQQPAIPVKGEAVLNNLIQAYLQANVDDNNRIADSTMAFIDSRLLIVSDQLSDIEKQIQSFKQRNQLADITAQSQALIENTSDYAKQVTAQQVQLSVIESLEQYIQANKDNPRIVPASLAVQDPMLSSIITQYNELLLQRSRLMLSATENNPVVVNMDEQIKNLRSDLINGIASVKKSAEVALEQLNGQQGNMQSLIQQVPAKERVYLDYSRQQEVRQALYLFLLQKREETAISKSSTMANARIIDAGKAEPKPISPKAILIFPVALLLGLLLPFGFVYARDLLNTKIISKGDIEKETKIPIVGEIGHKGEAGLVVVDGTSRSLVAEQFRALRTNLQFLLTHQDEKVIMVTSSMSGEGKSFISTNLALALAITGKKVVLMELDLRKPKITSGLGLSAAVGFSSYVIGQAGVKDILLPTGLNDHLYLIPSGPVPPNPAELLLHERTKTLFAQLRSDFDYIVVDTTPNLVTDAQLLSEHADATLYLVRMGVTHRDQLRIPNELHKQRKMPKLSLVVNDIRQKRYGGGYYGYGYGYGNGYGYGHYAEGKRKGKKRKIVA